MRKIYEAHQLVRLYEQAQVGQGMTSNELYESMALQFTYKFEKLYELSYKLVHVFAGYGINGACALAVARLLGERNYKVQVYLFYKAGELEPMCEYQRERLEQSGSKVSLTEVSREFRMPFFAQGEVVIDGLFGSELVRPLASGYVSLIRKINASGLPIVSIDMPSGLYAQYNTEVEHAQAVQATHTITFETPRLAMLFEENTHHTGHWHVVPLGIGAEAHQAVESKYRMISDEILSTQLRIRERSIGKRICGTALLIGGSMGMYGRLSLAAKSALKAGCGSLVAHAPLRVQGLLPLTLPEADMTLQELTDLPHGIHHYEAVAIGTGLQTRDLEAAYLEDFFATYARPVILDDGAIDLLCSDSKLLALTPRHSILLCSKERQIKLFGHKDCTLDLIEEASELAIKYMLTVVLKGPYTIVCSPQGTVYFNVTGNAALATAGSGDVLTGIILGLRTRGYDDVTACLCGCYIHGRAAEIFAARESEESLLASDLISYIGKVLKEL